MVELLRTNDIVLLSFVRSLLEGEGIRPIGLDEHMSGMEGSVSAIQRRVVVDDDDADRARRVLRREGLGEHLSR